MTPALVSTREGSTMTLTLNRPSRLNALDTGLLREMADAIAAFEVDDDLLVAVLRGAGGKAFSSGSDLKEMVASEGPDAFPVPEAGIVEGLAEVEACTKPVIAAIDGYCLAGGLELALLSDIRLATRRSQMGMPEARWGLVGGPALQYLRRAAPLGEALLLYLTGVPMDAERAFEIGLLQGLADDAADLDRLVRATSDAIASNSPTAVRTIKHLVRAAGDQSIAEARAFALPLQRALAQGTAARTGTQAFTAREGQAP